MNKKIINKIKELEPYNADYKIFKILKELWLSTSISTIRKYTKQWRKIIYICDECKKRFKSINYKKYCSDCSSKRVKLRQEKLKSIWHTKALKEIMDETKKITWLSQDEIKLLLFYNTHTEIQEYTKKNWAPPPLWLIL